MLFRHKTSRNVTHLAIVVAILLASVSAFAAEPMGRGNSSLTNLAQFGDTWVFAAEGMGAKRNLWRTDGTSEGTWRLTDVAIGSVSSPTAVLGDKLYFAQVQSDGDMTSSLHVTDGTIAGTARVASLPEVTYVDSMIANDSQVFLFTRKRNANSDRTTIIRSDGTDAGTHILAELPAGYVHDTKKVGNLIYFELDSFDDPKALWRTDGTAAGTVKLAQQWSRGYFIDLRTSAVLGNTFVLNLMGRAMITDGTPEGTRALFPDIAYVVGSAGGFAYIWTLGELRKVDAAGNWTRITDLYGPTLGGAGVSDGNRLYLFNAYPPYSLMVTDGTPETTRVIPLGAHAKMGSMLNGFVYFSQQSEAGVELWKSDGTIEGTTRTARIGPRRASYPDYLIKQFVTNGDRIAFVADDSIHGFEPWITDGTSAGTKMIVNVNPEMTLQGRVTDAGTGSPISDARIQVTMKDCNFYCSEHFPVRADGTYEIEGLRRGDIFLNASSASQSHIPQNWNARECVPCDIRTGVAIPSVQGETRPGIDFNLNRSGKFAGRIHDRNDAPVSGVEVHVAKVYGQPLTKTVSRADGSYETHEAIPRDEPLLLYTTDTAGYSGVIYPSVSCAAGCTSSSDGPRLAVSAGQTLRGLDFSVKPWGKLRGRILDHATGQDAELAGAPFLLTTVPHTPPGNTSINGNEFTIALPDGRYRLLVRPSTPMQFYRGTWFPDQTCTTSQCQTPAGTFVSPTAGAITDGYAFQLQPTGGRINGRVTDALTGLPLPGISLRIVDRGGLGLASVTTDASGYYSSLPRLAPDAYWVETTDEAPWFPARYGSGDSICRPFSCNGAPIVVKGNEARTGIDLQLRKFALVTGVVVDATTRQPLRGVQITVEETSADRTTLDTETSHRGRYDLSGLRPGRYVLTATKTGWTPKSQSIPDLQYGSHTEVSVTMDPACPISALIPRIVSFDAAGGTATIETGDGCTRCASTSSEFIHVQNDCTSGPIRYRVEQNKTGNGREGVIQLPGETIVIRQRP